VLFRSVVMVDQKVPQIGLCPFQRANDRPRVVGYRPAKGLFQKQRDLVKRFGLAVVFRPLAGRQTDKAVFLQAQQEVSGGIGFKLAVGLSPLPGFTQLHGNETSPVAVVTANGLVDERDVTGSQISAPVTKDNGLWVAFCGHGNHIAGNLF